MNCQDVQEENPLLHCSFEGGRHVGPPKGRTGDAIVEATTQKGLQDVPPSPAYEILRTRLALGQCLQPQQIPDDETDEWDRKSLLPTDRPLSLKPCDDLMSKCCCLG